MQLRTDVITDLKGNTVKGASVRVLLLDGTLATIYAANGGAPGPNPLPLTGSSGQYSYYAPNGRYQEEISVGGHVLGTNHDVLLYDPADDAEHATLAGLAEDGGAALIGNGTETVADSLNALQLADYTALRAYAGPRKSVNVTGYLGTAAPSGIAGMFVRDDSDTTTADNGGTVIVAGNGKRWKRQYKDGADPRWFGADGSGAADSRAAIQSAVNADLRVYFDPGCTFLVDNSVNRVYLRSGSKLYGGGSIKRTNDQWSIFEAIGTISNHITDVEVVGLVGIGTDFAGNTDKGTALIRATFIDNLRVTGCTVKNIGLVSVGVYAESGTTTMLDIGTIGAGGVYDSLTIDNLSRNVVVTGNTITSDTYHASNYWSMIFVGVRDWVVSNNVWNAQCGGPLFVGGINGNGTYLNTATNLKCFGGTFSVNVIDCKRGGFMLWNCRDVTVSGNTFVNQVVEPLDIEACTDVEVTGNKIRTSAFGITVYYDCNNLTIDGNDVVIDLSAGGGPTSFLIDSSASANFGQCIVKNNRFVAINHAINSGTRVSAVQVYYGSTLIFEDNYLEQTVVLDYGNHGYLSYSKNTVVLDGSYATTYNGATRIPFDMAGNTLTKSGGGGNALFDFNRNTFLSKNATVAVNCLRLAASSVDSTYSVVGNVVEKYASLFDINPPTVTAIASSGKKHSLVVEDNRMDTTTSPTVQGSLTSAQFSLIWKNNQKIDGTDFYGASPAGTSSSLFSPGSIVYSNDPGTNKQAGWICTAQAYPGSTWQQYGNLIETGTWTPSLGGSATYYGQSGTYTKIGRLVFVDGSLNIDVPGTGSLNSFSGLPFAPAASGDNITIGYCSGLSTPIVSIFGRASPSGTVTLYSRTSASSSVAANNVIQNATQLEFSGVYYV